MKSLSLLILTTLLTLYTTSAAELKFTNLEREVHATLGDEMVDVHFPFTIAGPGKVKVAEIKPGCSCIQANFNQPQKMTWNSGEKGEIIATFRIGKMDRGLKQKGIGIRLEGQKFPSITLKAKIHIPNLLKITPTHLRWQIADAKKPKDFTIKVTQDNPVHITQIEAQNSNFSHELITITKGREYKLRITPRREGPVFGAFKLHTDAPQPRFKVYQLYTVTR